MAKFQRGVIAEDNLHSLYLMFKIHAGYETRIRQLLAEFNDIIDDLSDSYSEAELTGFAAIGSQRWSSIYPDAKPKALTDFPNLTTEYHDAPATPYDLFIQIRSDRADVNHLTGIRICQHFSDVVFLLAQVKGFRYLDGRDLTGFIAASDNPHGVKRKTVALVDEKQDPVFAGGSYIHIQRYRHLMVSWNQLNEAEQEAIMGREKSSNQRLAEPQTNSHLNKSQLIGEGAQPIELLNQSMPYGTMLMQGLFYISCCHSPEPFCQILASRLGVNHESYDRLLDYSRAESGAAFFAPSVDFFKQNG